MSATTTMTAKELVQEFYAAGGPVGDPARFPEFFTDDYVSHTSPPGIEPGLGHAISLREFLTSVFSEAEYELVEVIAEGDLVATRTVLRGVHTGPQLGFEPTGKSFAADQMHFIRVENGKIAEHWGVRDDAGMLRQLGLIG
jgi:predicted ester cyclase